MFDVFWQLKKTRFAHLTIYRNIAFVDVLYNACIAKKNETSEKHEKG